MQKRPAFIVGLFLFRKLNIIVGNQSIKHECEYRKCPKGLSARKHSCFFALKTILHKDKRRAAYHRFYTNMKWGHAQNYHLTLDSGVVGIDRCVAIIAELYG